MNKDNSEKYRVYVPLPKVPLKAFLRSRGLIKDHESTLRLTQYSNGYSNLTYLLEIENRAFVLRAPPKGAIKRGHDMSREYKVLSALEKGFKIAPKTISYSEDLSIIGAPFYLMEKIEGIILTAKEALKRNIKAEDFKTISNTWLDMFVNLHKVDFKSIGLAELGKPNGYIERQVTNWGKQYIKAATMDIPEAGKLMKWMQDNQPEDFDHCFIHNDYKYNNVVFQNDSWNEISAILDWEMCTLGDPLMDLGTSIAYWMTTSDGLASKILVSPTLMEGNPSRTDIVQSYSEKSGRNINNIVFYYAYGLFKIAVIVQQIFYRYKKGLTKNEKFANLDRACELFCKMGWRAVEKNRIENFM